MTTITRKPINAAAAEMVAARASLVAAALEPGIPFTAVLAQEDVWTSDGRRFDAGSVTWRDLPLPLMVQTVLAHGHDGAVIGGRIDMIAREGANIVGAGVFNMTEPGIEAARLAADGTLTGVSIDGGAYKSTIAENDEGDFTETFQAVELLGATVTPHPAFADARIVVLEADLEAAMGGEPAEPAEAVAAAAGPGLPDRAMFTDPGLSGPTRLTVSGDGEVFGHIAQFGTCHRGIVNRCVLAPKSASNYAHFATGATRVADGGLVPTGILTMGCGHPDDRAALSDVRAHYDGGPGAVAMAAVGVGEDAHGIWCHGMILPGRTPEQVDEFAAQSLSGDWRQIGGRLELIAAVAVPVPGFPILDGMAASAGPRAAVDSGDVVALVAAGMVADCGCEPEPAAPMTATLREMAAEHLNRKMLRVRAGIVEARAVKATS